MLKAIMAVDDDDGVSKSGSIPWPKNSSDLKWFKKNTFNQIDILITSINGVFDDIDSGKGTLSKLLADDSLYNNLNKTAFNLDELLSHINENPKHFFAPLGKSRKKIERDLKKQKKIN